MNRHYLFDNKSLKGNSWNLKDAFNLAFHNPLKQNNKSEAMLNFLYSFPHYSYFLQDYLNERCKGDVNDENFERAFTLLHFVPKLEDLLSKIEGNRVSFFA